MNCRYVTKNEVKERKAFLENIIPYIKSKFKEEYGFSFNHSLVGSAKRNLVVQRKNSKWDIDYRFYFTSPKIHDIDSIKLKKYIKNIIQDELGDCYSVNYSRSVLTITDLCSINKNEIDIAIIKNNKNLDGVEILRHKSENPQDNNSIKWEQLSNYGDLYRKYKQIRGSGEWGEFREIYKKKKCIEIGKNKQEQKPGISILLETINEFWN